MGIDEVGRGSLAGPVVVAAVAVPKELRIRNYELGKLRDSKKLSAKQRELWFEYFKKHPQITYSLAKVYPRVIERKNISKAANLAALRAFRRLVSSFPEAEPRRKASFQRGRQVRYGAGKFQDPRFKIFLDGGLYLGNNITTSQVVNNRTCDVKTLIKGDEKITAIKAASILAKVSRDRFMKRLAKKYPRYGFEVHKGYGTKRHMRAIKKYGPSPAHRLTFLRFS